MEDGEAFGGESFMGAECCEGEILFEGGVTEMNVRGWAMEGVGEGSKQGAEYIEMIVVGDGKAFEMEVMIDGGSQGGGAFAGMEDENADILLLGEAAQEGKQFAVIALEEGTKGGQVIDHEQACIGIVSKPALKLVQTLGGRERSPGIGKEEIVGWGSAGLGGE